jgi:hypothetical protein
MLAGALNSDGLYHWYMLLDFGDGELVEPRHLKKASP